MTCASASQMRTVVRAVQPLPGELRYRRVPGEASRRHVFVAAAMRRQQPEDAPAGVLEGTYVRGELPVAM